MKRNYFTLKFYTLFACIFFAGIFALSAQVKKPFEVRYQDNIKGDITFIGNNIVNRNGGGNQRPNNAYNRTGDRSDYNDDLDMQYIDIDNDRSTFSSSSASLSIPDPNCIRVVYAGLYWIAKYPFEEGDGARNGGYRIVNPNRHNFEEIKFKIPGREYIDIIADEVIYDGIVDDPDGDVPYTCYKDITDIISGLIDPSGEYTIANVRAAKGFIKGGGAAGWSMVVVYENPNLPGKFITTFDGFAGIDSEDPPVDINVDGFITLPEPFPVKANMIVSTLEGDNRIEGDGLSIRAEDNPEFFPLGTSYPSSINRSDNFFDSNITLNHEIVTTRNPNSVNTLGFDTDKFKIPNSNKSVIPNNANNATLRMSTEGDTYYVYFTSFDVEVIEPDIKLIKGVYDKEGRSIQGEEIQLGQELEYTLTFDNIGNDDATGFTIRDILPLNVDLVDVILPPAIAGGQKIDTSYVYETNEIIFTVPDTYVEVARGGDNTVTIDEDYTIRINVKVQENCDELRDACSDIVKNTAYVSYRGVLNDNQITRDPSILGLTACLFELEGATNFLPALELCGSFERSVDLCGESTVLTAGANYDRYQWFELNDAGVFVELPGETNQTYSTSVTGTFKVEKETDEEDCKDFEEIITVNIRGTDNTSPFASVADELVNCTNDGSILPKFYLCGTNDDIPLTVNFPDARSLVWEKIVEGCSEREDLDSDCATKGNSCNWQEVGTGNQYLLSGQGEYRLVVTYENGCFNRFYFKAYENSLSPVVESKDMACGNAGYIEISNVGSEYEYAIGIGEEDYQADELVWQESAYFEIETAGIYGVYIRQRDVEVGVGDREPCLFRGEDQVIQDLTFGFTAIPSAPLCFDGKGSIAVNISGALPHYSFKLLDSDRNVIEQHLASQDNFYEFSNQTPGTYFVEVSTEDGCEDEKEVVIPNGEQIDFTATPHDIACDDGSVALNVTDGTGSYTYAVWSYTSGDGATKTSFQKTDISQIPATAYFTNDLYTVAQGEQGTYVFLVTNAEGCNSFSNEVTVKNNPPVDWSLEGTNLSCFQSNDGVINVVHGGTNGYTLTYQLIDLNGNPIDSEDGQFNNLPAGRNYKVIVTQTYGDQSCSTEDLITLTEPDRLTASAGVSKLPGCNDTDIELAEVRITNPLGGTPPYRYSFDGIHYTTSAIGHLKADTHTIYIMDDADCVFPMEVEIPDLPVIPTTEVSYTYNCDGTGNVVVIPSIPDYEYTYDIDGTPVIGDFEDGFTFDDLAPGEHTVTVHYNNPNYVTYSNLLKEDFGRGANTTSPYIDAKYVYESQLDNDSNPDDPEGEFNIQINDGEYSVTNTIRHLFYGWISPNDHTDPNDIHGRYMAINIGGVAGVNGVIFKKRVYDVIPHQKISVELEAFNLIGEGSENRDDPFLLIQLVEDNGTVIDQIYTDRIPRHTDENSWINYAVELNPGNNEELDIVIRTQNDEISGNDIAIDDILAYQIPEKCDLTLEVPINIESKPFSAKIDGVTDALCSGADNGEIEVSVSNFDPAQGFQYSIDDGTNWSEVITSSPFTITGLSAGDYKIVVRDVRDTENCVQELEESIEDPSPLVLSAEVTTPMSCSNNYTAVITVMAQGGNDTFEYRLEGENGYVVDFQAENIFTVVGLDKIGNYTISVRDGNNCTSPTTANVVLVAPEEVDIALTTDTCIIDNNGIIHVTVNDGNGNYQFSLDNTNWNNPDASTPTTYTFDGLVPGESYTVYVKDGMGCPDSETITLNDPLSITANAQTSISCFGSADGTLIIDINNFDTSFTYAIDGTEEGNIYTLNRLLIENISSGSHTIEVTDLNGCTVSYEFEIASPPASLTAAIDSITEITCISDGSVTISASQGWGSYTYELTSTDGTIAVGPQNEATFTNLPAGDYEVIVRDAGGCAVPVTFNLQEPESPEVTLAPSSDLCNSDAGVLLIATAIKGKAPFKYQLNGGEPQSSNEFTVLVADNYTVTVIDANGCTATSTTAIVINEELQVSASLAKDLDCSATQEAAITLTINGGYPTYTMEVLKDGTSIATEVPVSGGDIYNTLDPGVYSFIITDSEGCTDTTNIVEVTDKAPPAVTKISVDPTCAGSSDGSIELQITGGLPPYTINLHGSTSTKIGGLAAGTYSYTVTDSKGCEAGGSVTLIDPDPIIPGTISLIEDYRCDNSSAIIELTGYSGGTVDDPSDYEFSLDNLNYQASPRFDTNILPGNYTIYIRDSNGCIASEDITIDPLIKPTGLSFSASAMICPALTSDVTVEVEGGNEPFTYKIIAPTGSVVDNAGDKIITGLSAGTYTFEVTDAKGCTIVDTYTVEEISQIDLEIGTSVTRVCTGGSTGSITALVSDFENSYSYSLVDASNNEIAAETNQTLETFELTNLGEGTYTLTVTDETTKCTDVITQTISAPINILGLTLDYTPVTCVSNGSITANATGGWGNFTYQLEDNSTNTILTNYQVSNTFNDISPGEYLVRVKDEMGCIETSTITLSPATPPTVLVESTSNFCYDPTTLASLTVTISEGVAPYSYKLNGQEAVIVPNNETSFILSDLEPGTYNIEVIDSFGCKSTVISETIENQLTAASVVSKTLDCTATPEGEIEVNVSGGYSPYTYAVSTDGGANWSVSEVPITGSTFTYSNIKNLGTYTFRITDAKGCTITTEKVVEPIVKPDISQIVVTDATCYDSATGALDVQIDQTKGVAPYTIEVFEDIGEGTRGTSFGNQTTNLPAGDYIVVVTDAKECEVEEKAEIGEPDELITTIVANPLQCIDGEGIKLGSIEVTVDSGGTGNFTIELYDRNNALVEPIPNNPSTGEGYNSPVLFDGLNYGDYTIRIVDSNGCETLKEATVSSYPNIILETSGGAACGIFDGSMTVTANTTHPDATLNGGFYFAIYPYEFAFDPTEADNPDDEWFPGGGPDNKSYTFHGLQPGVEYKFVVFDVDSGCEYIEIETEPVDYQSSLIPVIEEEINVTCKGAEDGYAVFSLTGFDPNATDIKYQVYNAYDYKPVEDADGTISIAGATTISGSTPSNLPPGEYYIIFTEVVSGIDGCVMASETFKISESFQQLELAASSSNDNCDVNAGIITATAIFGTPQYEYQYISWSGVIGEEPISPAPTDGNWTINSTFKGESGNYMVFVKDANNCIVSEPVIINLDPSPEIILSVTNLCTANSGSFSVDVELSTAGVGPYWISVDGGPFERAIALDGTVTTQSFSNLNPGTHSFAIIDYNGCGVTESIEIFPPLMAQGNIIAEAFCDPITNGKINIIATGGSGDFSYEILSGPATNSTGDSNGAYTGLEAGDYEFQVTDNVTDCGTIVESRLVPPVDPTFTLTPTDVSCNDGNDGTITIVLDPSNVDGPYEYVLVQIDENDSEIPGTEVVQNGVDWTFSGLEEGNYKVTVLSSKECSDSLKVTINEPPVLELTASATPFTCGQNYSIVTATVHNTNFGKPPYTYSFDGEGFQLDNFKQFPYGTGDVIIVVRDVNGCTDDVTVNVPDENKFDATFGNTVDINCLNNQETVDIIITEGSGDFTVTQMPSGNPQINWTSIVLTEPGTYVYHIVDNQTGCSDTIQYTVEPFDLINATASVITHETCSNSEDGRISVEVSGYEGEISYTVLDKDGAIMAGVGGTATVNETNPTFEVLHNFDSGIYHVSIEALDSPFCSTITNTVTITEPDPIQVELISNVNANCNESNSTVTVHASGGTAPYSYAAVANGSVAPSDPNDYQNGNEFSLDPATSSWDIYVMDANGCIIISPIDIDVELDTTPDISLSIVDECAKENEFDIVVALDPISKGVGPYQITLDAEAPRAVNEADFPITLRGLSSGIHTVSIIDSNGCGDLETISILDPLSLIATVESQPSCTVGGVINFNPEGGSSNYYPELLYSDGTDTSIPATGNQFIDVPAGDYIVKITDTDGDGSTDLDTGCTIEFPVTLEEATPVVFNLNKVDVSCHDGSNGSIQIQLDASNDQPPYTYELVQLDAANGNVIGTPKTQNGGNTIFTGLPGGFYRVTITSDRGCIETEEIEILNPPALGITTELYGNCSSADGYALQITLTDIGTAPYKLRVNGALQDVEFIAGIATVDHLSAGSYSVEIIDANGCSFTAVTSVDIVPLNFNRSLTTLLDCEAGADGNGAITLSEIRGSGNYHYTITGPAGISDAGSFPGTEFEWTGVTTPGMYTIRLSDAAAAGGCEVVKTIDVPGIIYPDFNVKGFDAKCHGVHNGSIYASAIDNGTGPYIFEIIEIGGNSITPAIPADDPTPGYEATFSNLEGSDSGLEYIVRATSTTNACYSDIDVSLSQATPMIGFSASVTPFGCSTFNNGANAVVTVTPPTGGSGTYRYEFVYDNGTPGEPSDDKTQNSTRTEFTVSNPIGGSITATVLDSNGCTGTSVTMAIEPFVELQEIGTVITQPTCHGNDGSILVETVLVNAVLGIGNDQLQYEITSVDGSNSSTVVLNSSDATPLDHLFDNLAVGGYTITVTNLNTGCEVSTTALLNDPNTFDVKVTKIQDVVCYGSETGIVDVNLIDDTYTVSFNWTIYNAQDDTVVKSGTDADNTGIHLFAGRYYVEITQVDSPFCANVSYFNISQSDSPLTIDSKVSKSISCTDPGEITVTASGGYGFYEFKLVDKVTGGIIQDWSTQNVFISISEGTYDVFVRDDKGCDQVSQELTLHQPVQITADAIQGDVIYCDGEMTASIEVINVTGGRPAVDPSKGYLYVLNRLDSNGNIVSSTSAQTNNVFTGLQAGSYSVKVFDNFGCDVLTNVVVVEQPDQVLASLGLVKSNTCETGAILELTATGGTGTGYEYSISATGPWIPFGSNNSVEIDIPGAITAEEIHTYYVRDSNLCISSISNSVTLSPIRALEVTPTVVSDVSCYGDATGYIKVDVKGGLGNYKYTLIDAIRNVTLIDKQDGNTFSGLSSGVYFVQVDSEDCFEQVRVQIDQGAELTAKAPVIFNPVCTDDLGSIEVELVGGTGEYQYAISPNLDQFQSKNVFEDLAPGTYTIIAQDSKGCNPFVFKENIIAPPPLEAKANVLNEEYCTGDGTGSFELIIQGGTPPYSTAVNTQDNNAFEQDRRIFNGLKGGETYVVFVRDANGCQQHVQVSLKEPIDLNPQAEVRVTCVSNAAANEVQIIIGQQDLEDVIYTLDGGADQFDNKFTNVAPGEHTVTVSYFGCEREVQFTVDPVQPLGLTVNESNLNEFTMYPNGGTAPYEYFVDGVSQGSEPSYVIRVSGVYQVMIVDANGCQQIAQIDMEFIDIKIPNVFTPNGDGQNDYWPPSNYSLHYPNIITKIYDRYGRVVAELRQGDTWNGRYNGTELPTGDYWYVMKLNGDTDDREFVGHFTLYR